MIFDTGSNTRADSLRYGNHSYLYFYVHTASIKLRMVRGAEYPYGHDVVFRVTLCRRNAIPPHRLYQIKKLSPQIRDESQAHAVPLCFPSSEGRLVGYNHIRRFNNEA